MIPNENGAFHRIGLVGLLWKTVTGILNHCKKAAIQFHDIVYFFHTERGISTASIEAKMLQHLAEMREDFLYEIFLDLHKAYDAFDCGLGLDFLVVYGIGPHSLCLLWTYWGHFLMLAREYRYFVSCSRYIAVWSRGTCFPSRYSIWWWIHSYVNIYLW